MCYFPYGTIHKSQWPFTHQLHILMTSFPDPVLCPVGIFTFLNSGFLWYGLYGSSLGYNRNVTTGMFDLCKELLFAGLFSVIGVCGRFFKMSALCSVDMLRSRSEWLDKTVNCRKTYWLWFLYSGGDGNQGLRRLQCKLIYFPKQSVNLHI